MNYNDLYNLDEDDKESLIATLQGIFLSLRSASIDKALRYIRYIPTQCRMSYNSAENRRVRDRHPQKYHPVKPKRGEIYNAYITEGVGSELCGNHPIIILQNTKANIYSEKVNILPIEGDGMRINVRYHVQLTENELCSGRLVKIPSRVIVTDIMTIDKARLGRKIGCITPQCFESIEKLLRRQLNI